MKTFATKTTSVRQNESDARSVSQSRQEPAPGYQIGAAAQLRDMACTCQQAKSAAEYQEMATSSPVVTAQAQMGEMIASSPKMTAQRKQHSAVFGPVVQQKSSGRLPEKLQSGLESLSGIDMSDVQVHYNSSKPAQLNALAYTQGNQIHLGPGQEKHLPHEAWHAVQQKQGRVEPTMSLRGTPINDDVALENEADTMGSKALR